MKSFLIPVFISLCYVFVPPVSSIECYNGMRFLKGMSVGTATVKCDNSGAYCYNMSATTATVIDVTKAGCSMWRCMFAQNKCISTVFQNIPISLCCCNTPLCNVGGEGGDVIQPQQSGGWNAEPEHTRTDLSKDEIERRFNSAELDDDRDHHTRAARFVTSSPIEVDEESRNNGTLEDEKDDDEFMALL